MTTVKEIWEAIDRMAPFDTAEDFDNVGLLIGAEDQPVSRCLVTLDVTADAWILNGYDETDILQHYAGWVLFRNFLIPALEALFPTLSESWYFQYFLNQIPSAAVAVAVVLLGVHLVRGKRKPKEEEYVEYRGERHD